MTEQVRVFVALLLTSLCLTAAAGPPPDPATMGQWSAVTSLPTTLTHAHLLTNGQVLFVGEWAAGDTPYLWDPATADVTPAALPGFNAFCGGHTFLGDGRLLTVGGFVAAHVGLPNASTYDAASGSWTAQPNMNNSRYYPTLIALANGDALVVSGEIANTGNDDPVDEVFSLATGKWRELSAAKKVIPFFPRSFVAPDGRVLIIDNESTLTWWLDTTGKGVLTPGPPTTLMDRSYGNAVMYAPGKIIRIGGGLAPPSATTELIDLNAPTPSWQPGPPMAFARRQQNATILPDGTVFVNGGSDGSSFSDPKGSVPASELWDPATGQWTTLAKAGSFRGYHSTGLLLPDGRVLTGGGSTVALETDEVFSPPYLFKGDRPVLPQAPSQLWPAAPFRLALADADQIDKVSLVRLGSVTHSWNMSQRYVPLSFQVDPGAGSLTIQGPDDNNAAPAGPYLLFLVNKAGVPSIGQFVQVVYGPTAGPPPPLEALDAGAPPEEADTGSDVGSDTGPAPKEGHSGSGCSTTSGVSTLLATLLAALGMGLLQRRGTSRR